MKTSFDSALRLQYQSVSKQFTKSLRSPKPTLAFKLFWLGLVWRRANEMPCLMHSRMNGQGQTPDSDDAARPAPPRGQPSEMLDMGPTKEPSVPDYELLRRIGRGAYGDVWLARSQATGALRAAKIVWRHTFEDAEPFKREFEGIQRFERISREHPSQLALFHIGRNEPAGYFYYVMELADAGGAGRRGWRISDGEWSANPNLRRPSSIFHHRSSSLHRRTRCAQIWKMAGCRPHACWRSVWR